MGERGGEGTKRESRWGASPVGTMQGMYVDAASRMVLVLLTGQRGDLSHYHVYDCEATDPEGWSAICTRHADSAVELTGSKGEEGIGHVSDEGSIVWDSGDVWHGVHMSALQFDLLTRRPYVPLTYLFIVAMHSLFCRAKSFFLPRGLRS